MKRLIFAALASGAFVTPVLASSWNGPYLGIDAGYGWGKAKQPFSIGHGTPLTSTEADADLNGWQAGGHLGWNWKVSSMFVIGAEWEGTWSNISGDDGGSGGDTNEVEAKWETSVAGRAGILVAPNALLYGLAGYSWLNADMNKKNVSPVSKSATFNGWTYGGGIEFDICPQWTGRVEYRFNDYDQKRVNMTPLPYDLGVTNRISTVTAGISVHF